MQILLAVRGGIAVLVVVALALSLRKVVGQQIGVDKNTTVPAAPTNGFPGER